MQIGKLLLVFGLTCAASAYGQSLDRVLDRDGARAMLGRFGYGADAASLQATIGLTPRQYLETAITGETRYPPSVLASIAALPTSEPLSETLSRYGPGGSESSKTDPESRQELRKIGSRYLNASIQERLLQMANADNQGHEILLDFWLNHFSIFGNKNINQYLSHDYARTLATALRQDSFLALLRASFFHPAMQYYLDNTASIGVNSRQGKATAARGKPQGLNENLARELLELHTLGIDGGYTQNDVTELARIITGTAIYNPVLPGHQASDVIRLNQFIFVPARHDFAAKTLLGQNYPAGRGLEEIEEALAQLASYPATARHLSLKLARRFLADEPPAEVVEEMTKAYLRSHGRISATLFALVDSAAFAASLQQPGKFKEPLDYLLSSARAACNGRPIANGQYLLNTANDFGQAPFRRSTPDGYSPQARDWLSSAAISKRIRLAVAIARRQAPLAGLPAELKGDAACRPQLDAVRLSMPTLSARSGAALAGLNDSETIAALLASPEFMYR